jgi:hypothetical protein
MQLFLGARPAQTGRHSPHGGHAVRISETDPVLPSARTDSHGITLVSLRVRENRPLHRRLYRRRPAAIAYFPFAPGELKRRLST